MTFALRLKELRKKMGVSQSGLAEELGVTKQTISLWERGPRKPEQETLRKLVQLFDVSEEYLLGVSDEPTRDEAQLDQERMQIYLDDIELQTMAWNICQLSPEMRRIVKATVQEAYRIDRERDTLKPASDYRVKIRSTVLEVKFQDETDDQFLRRLKAKSE